eukprot:UN32937
MIIKGPRKMMIGRNSGYKGVFWDGISWCARIQYPKGSFIDGGTFESAQKAAIDVNKLCRQNGLPVMNPGVEKETCSLGGPTPATVK